LAWVQIAVRE
jgi:hypothetical protein